MSIKKLSLRNFQCHIKKELELNSGVNIFTGESDTGKSALIRAIELVRTNRPQGTDHFTHDAESCCVKIETNNGLVERIRNKKENGYSINGKNLSALGSSVPSEVFDVLKLSDLNVQNQHDPPFLLTCSSGEVAKKLNEYVDLCEGDLLIAEINKGLNKANSEAKQASRNIESIENELKLFIGYDDILLKANEHDELCNKIKNNEERNKIYKEYVNQYNRSNKIVEMIVPDYGDFEKVSVLLANKEQNILSLESLKNRYNKLQKAVNVDLTKITDLVNELQNIYDSLNTFKMKRESLKDQVSFHKTEQNEIEVQTQFEKNIQKEINKLSGTICESCGQTIKI